MNKCGGIIVPRSFGDAEQLIQVVAAFISA